MKKKIKKKIEKKLKKNNKKNNKNFKKPLDLLYDPCQIDFWLWRKKKIKKKK